MVVSFLTNAEWVNCKDTEMNAGYPSHIIQCFPSGKCNTQVFRNLCPEGATAHSQKPIQHKLDNGPWRTVFNTSIIKPSRGNHQCFSRPTAFRFDTARQIVVAATVIDDYYSGTWESVPTLIVKVDGKPWQFTDLFGEPEEYKNNKRVVASGISLFRVEREGKFQRWVIYSDGYGVKLSGMYTPQENLINAEWKFFRDKEGNILELFPNINKALFPHCINYNWKGICTSTDKWIPKNITTQVLGNDFRFKIESVLHVPQKTKGITPYIKDGKLYGLLTKAIPGGWRVYNCLWQD